MKKLVTFITISTMSVSLFAQTANYTALTNGTSISDKNKDFDTLSKLEVTGDKHIVAAKEVANPKMFIAPQVESFVPDIVSEGRDFIPNIYAMSKECIENTKGKILRVTMSNAHGLKAGDRVRIFIENIKKEVLVSATSKNSFTINNWTEKVDENVFVFGKEVESSSLADYDYIFALNASTTQALSKRNEILDYRITELEKKKEILENNLNNLEVKISSILKKLE